MKIFNNKREIYNYLDEIRAAGKTVGFVPTMGALHDGHLSLIELARKRAEVVVCSIFVNPTQFNDKKDLENYPRPIEADMEKLRLFHCDVLFIPEVAEMYDTSAHWDLELGNLDQILEGSIRPGHYQGVTQIVKKLFDVVKPDFAFFGQKDYQQIMVIAHMVKKLEIKVKLIICPIIREIDGLAMSSRNIYLLPEERQNALALFKSLTLAQQLFKTESILQVKLQATHFLESCPGIQIEYFEILNADTFEPPSFSDSETIIALVAARIGKIRIIDNMYLNKDNQY